MANRISPARLASVVSGSSLLFVLLACGGSSSTTPGGGGNNLSDTLIAFSSNRVGATDQIFVMKPDGTNPVQLTSGTSSNNNPKWTPDRSRIVFVSFRDGNSEIYVMNSDGSNQVRLTNNSATDWSPAVSPDGTKVAFESNRDGNSEIYVVDINGSNLTRLTNNASNDKWPFWKPDGTKIGYATPVTLNTMNPDGTGQAPIQGSPVVGTNPNPSWSPDGSKIAFEMRGFGIPRIYVINADGSNSTELTQGTNDGMVSWSPDGSKLIFGSFRNVVSGSSDLEIYTMNPDGTNQTRITTSAGSDGSPSWSNFPVF